MKPYVGKPATLNHKPVVTVVKVGKPRVEKSEVRNRTDTYVNLDLVVDGKPIKAQYHLMADRQFSGKKAYRSLDFNTAVRNGKHTTPECPICDGNCGVSSDETNGFTAIACAEAIVPEMEKIGLAAAVWDGTALGRKPGGWFIFESQAKFIADVKADPEQRKLPWGHVSWVETIECPVHGRFDSRTVEYDAD